MVNVIIGNNSANIRTKKLKRISNYDTNINKILTFKYFNTK